MKYPIIIGLLILFSIACSNETRENTPLPGHHFIRANPWKFFFVDAQGHDLLSLAPGSALPTIYETDPIPLFTVPLNRITNDYLYNGNGQQVSYDPDQELYAWSTSVPGNEWVTHKTFYVRLSETDTDTIRVTFQYITKDIIGGNLYARITHLYYNDTLVIKDDDYVSGNAIFIQKQDGRTTVSLR